MAFRQCASSHDFQERETIDIDGDSKDMENGRQVGQTPSDAS